MPSLADHQSSTSTKLLYLGDSGMGKTGSLLSLVEAGYNLRIADFDNGLDILVGLIKRKYPDPAKAAELFSRIDYHTLTDSFRVSGVNLIPTSANAWPRLIGLLDKWSDKIGPITTWSPQDILVIDSGTFAGRAAMRFIAQLNNRLAVPPYMSDYLEAQRKLESLYDMLYSTAVKCNVIVLTHIKEIYKIEEKMVQNAAGKDQIIRAKIAGTEKLYAETGIGQALSPIIGRFFNAILQADMIAGRRVIRTEPHTNITLKNPAPKAVKAILELDTGLAEYFKAVRA